MPYIEQGRVVFYRDYMTQKRLVEYLLTKIEVIFFASDIRTVTNDGVARGEYTNAQREHKIWFEDNMLQMDFVRALKPVESLLKFRLPFVLGNSDIIEEDKLNILKVLFILMFYWTKVNRNKTDTCER